MQVRSFTALIVEFAVFDPAADHAKSSIVALCRFVHIDLGIFPQRLCLLARQAGQGGYARDRGSLASALHMFETLLDKRTAREFCECSVSHTVF